MHPIIRNTSFVVLGAHTIGKARCAVFRGRIYNDTNIDTTFAKDLRKICSESNKTTPLDFQTAEKFDNKYFVNLIESRGLLHSDQELFKGGTTDKLVKNYVGSPNMFYSHFGQAMVKMGDISPLTGSEGEIRRNCRKVNEV